MVISYDISDDGTRSRIADILADYGNRVQYSVFECRIDAVTLDELVKRLEPFPECGDSIRVYQICEGCLKKAVILGSGEFVGEVGFILCEESPLSGYGMIMYRREYRGS